MRHCLYVSTAADLTETDIAEILGSAQRNNPRDDITGFLLYNGRNFLQLVEGDAAALQDLLMRIGNDGRHSGMIIVFNEEIARRACQGWAMQRIGIAVDVSARRQSLSEQLPAGIPSHIRQMVNNFALLN